MAQLEALCAEHPLRERLWRLLALALYRSGRQADALEACRAARGALDELGLEPSAELRELERDILRQSPRLAAPAAVVEHKPEQEVGERRVVSVLAAEVAPRRTRRCCGRRWRGCLEAASAAVGRHGGAVERFGPEGLTAVFGADERHEDDALRAVRAAVELHESASLPVAVATGEAIVADEPHVAGAAVQRAAVMARLAAVEGSSSIRPRMPWSVTQSRPRAQRRRSGWWRCGRGGVTRAPTRRSSAGRPS